MREMHNFYNEHMKETSERYARGMFVTIGGRPMPQYRQGDVFLVPLKGKELADFKKAEAAKKLEAKKDRIVAYGEVTGHHHILNEEADVLVNEKGEIFVRAKDGTLLEHLDGAGAEADHKSIAVEPDVYKAVIQKEYQPGHKYRNVID